MKKDTITGLVLIAVILFAFTYINRPKNNPNNKNAETELAQADSAKVATNSSSAAVNSVADTTALAAKDAFSLQQEKAKEQLITLKNDSLAIQFSSLGAIPQSVELFGYKDLKPLKVNGKDTDKESNTPLYLFTKDDKFNLNFFLRTKSDKIFETDKLFFEPIQTNPDAVTFRLNIDSASYLDINYSLPKGDYRLAMTITGKNLQNFFPSNIRYLDFEMSQDMPQLEKSWSNENNYTGIYYKYLGDDVERVKETKRTAYEKLEEPLTWFAFKDKFFATTLIGNNDLHFENVTFNHKTYQKDTNHTKHLEAKGTVPFDVDAQVPISLTFFMGPLEHELLTSYDANVNPENRLHLEKLIYVGGSVFRAINLYIILPIVDFFKGFISNWGIIILLLTIVIKLLLTPLTYKSYLSQAKMRLLKPQAEAINAKYPGNDQAAQLKRSQETMRMYRNAGASPMSGCLPMLLQMPFLIALYMFFPTSIYLRGQHFLWVKDLSSYDAILSWDFNIPILSGLMGNHISLFCLLWAITNIFYSQYTMNSNAAGQQNQQMKMMKWMPWIMSIMFFFFFNNNASGLCYYYFIATLITVLQYMGSRYLINEKKVLAKLEENQKKPKKKSGFMARLEEAQRMQEKAMRERQQQQRRR